MSRRNTREAKARRRADREARADQPDTPGLVQVQPWDELVGQAQRGETLTCGCDAHDVVHDLLRGGGWQAFDD
jgi:hypothetical protein